MQFSSSTQTRRHSSSVSARDSPAENEQSNPARLSNHMSSARTFVQHQSSIARKSDVVRIAFEIERERESNLSQSDDYLFESQENEEKDFKTRETETTRKKSISWKEHYYCTTSTSTTSRYIHGHAHAFAFLPLSLRLACCSASDIPRVRPGPSAFAE